MNPDAFEQQLQRRELTQLPPEWRAEILGAAVAAREEQERTESPYGGVPWKRIRWGALAAVWIAIGTFGQLDPEERRSVGPALAYQDVLTAVRERTRLMAEVRANEEPVEIATPPAVRQRSGHRHDRKTATLQFA